MERHEAQRWRSAPRGSITLAVLVLALVPAACGGSYTKRDFIARADAICASSLRDARKIGPQGPGTATGGSGALSAYVVKLLPLLDTEASQLRALRRPSQSLRDRATLERWFAALAQEVAEYRQLAAAARLSDGQGVASAEAALRASPAAALATAYGLRACGIPQGTSA